MEGPIHKRSHLPVQNETSPLQKMRGWRNITKSTQERSHFLAPTVKIHLFVIIYGRHMKISTREGNHSPVTFVISHIQKVMQGAERLASMHGGKKPFSCCKFDKAFLQCGQLKTQEVTHTRDKPLVCSKCEKWFLQSSGLKTLQMICEAEEPFTCTISGIYTEKSFEDTLKDPHRKEAICLIQMSFSPNVALKKHLMFHTREDEKKT